MGSFTPAPSSVLSPGDRLDRYELVCMLAQGGMGSVWLARLVGKHGFERLVAVKTILPTYGSDRTFVDMFLDEARIAGQMDHENVVRTLEIGEDREVLYHAMELVDGESVRKLYRDVRSAGAAFPLGVALRIAADTLAGLHAVHELVGPDGKNLEVVHRDVSPQNILVTVRGTVKLIDFGVAKARQRRTEETTAGTLKGKIEYMAPEQANGTPVDRRADVYAVGAVLYELLAGEPLRNTEDGRQLLALHELMTGAPYEPLHAGVPLPVRTVVDRALANDPDDRYRTADDMRRAIEQAMVAIGLPTTTDDVASALVQYSKERTQRRRDAIDAAVKVAQQLERERGGPAPISSARSPSRLANDETYVTRSGTPAGMPIPGAGEAVGTLVQPLAIPAPVSSADLLAAHALDPMLMGAHQITGPQQILPAIVPTDGSASMRTMPGQSISASPPAAKSGFGTVVVLGFVGVLGVVAGVLLARQPGHTADGAGAKVSYVPANATTGTASASAASAVIAPPTLPPAPLPSGSLAPPGTAPAPSTVAVPPTSSPKDARDHVAPKSKPKPKKAKGDGDEYGF